jgi:ATP-dependent DNA helicase PIF1
MLLSEKNKHSLDKKIKFEKVGHKYWIDDDNTNVISVTTYIKKFFDEFDTHKAIQNIFKSYKYKNDPEYKYYNMTYDEIKKLWDDNGKMSSDLGTKLHEDIENFYNKDIYENESSEFKQFLDFYEDHKHLEIYRTEWLIFNENLKITGSIDAVFKNEDGTFSIYDWKRSKEIKYESDDCGDYPLEYLPNSNYYHYSLQLNYYKNILEIYYDIKIKDMFLIIMHPDNKDNKYIKIEIENMTKEIDLLNNIRVKELNKIEFENRNNKNNNNMEKLFSEKQKEAYNLILNGKNVFLTGPGGSGKTALIKTFFKEYKNYKKIGMTSTTGVSAILIGGSTLHSFLGIGLAKDECDALYLQIINNNKTKKKWTDLDVLIIDEISMLSPELFDKLERLARLVRKIDKPFGGIQLVLTGDMLQLPCVESEDFCFEAKSWNKCIDNIIYLKEIFRQDDIAFQNCLNEIRMGQISEDSIEMLKSRIGAKLENEHGIIPTKIYPLNVNVDKENETQLNKLLEKDESLEFFEYELEYNIVDKKIKFVQEKIKKICIAPHVLQICKGAQVMLVYNIDLEAKLANGSRGVVIGFENETNLPIVKFLTGESRVIEHQTWKIEENGKTILTITQIPLKVAFACSVHKIQGITLDYAEIDLKDIFEYGQSYVCISRVKRLQGLSLKNFDVDKIFANPKAVEFYKKLEEIDDQDYNENGTIRTSYGFK